MALTMAEVARDYETDGVPSSGSHKIKKGDLRNWGAWVEGIINAFVNVNGGLIFASKASLDASLNYAANTMAWVLGDATVANNGVYRKIGGSGAGSWTRVADLPFSFIIASDVGAGTANAIQATTSIPVSGSALVWTNVFETNTASPVTISFNGGSALTIKTNSGNNVASGGLVGGMIVIGIVSGSTFRLVSDQASAAIIAAAEAAQVAAELAQSAAAASAASAAASAAEVAGKFAANVIGADAGVTGGYAPSANAFGYSTNTTGSTNFPAVFGGTVSFMFGGAGRAWDMWKGNNGSEDWSLRSNLAGGSTFGPWRRIVHDGLKSDTAAAVAATDDEKYVTPLKVGQEIDGRVTKIGDGNSKTRTIPSRFGDTFDIEEYLTGDGATANDTAFANLISYMAANKQKVFRSRPGRVFRLTSGGFVLPADITLRMEGASFLLDGNLPAGTQFITTGARNNIDILSSRIASGRTMSRGYLIAGEGTLVDLLKFTSDDQQANTGSQFYSAVRIDGSYCNIGRIETEKFDQGWILYGDSKVGINVGTTIRSVRVNSYVRGGYVRNVSNASIYDNCAKTRSPNASPNPGHNAILLAGVEKSQFIGGVLEDAGEHNFRSGGFPEAEAGTGSFVAMTRALEISGYHIEGAGQSGFKIYAGTGTGRIHKDITVSDVKCIDCGDDGDALGFNDMGFMFQAVDGLNVSNCSVSSRNNTYGAYDGFFVHGCNWAKFVGCSSRDVQRNGLRISEFSDDNSLDPMSTNSVEFIGFTADEQTGAGIYINYPGSSSIRDLHIPSAHIILCTNGVEFSGAVGRFAQQSYCSAIIRGASGSRFAGATGQNWNPVDLTVLSGSATYDPASLADGAGVTATVTVTGAALGDHAQATFSNDLQGITLTAWVSAANTVSVRFQNESGGVIDLASGTIRTRVTRI